MLSRLEYFAKAPELMRAVPDRNEAIEGSGLELMQSGACVQGSGLRMRLPQLSGDEDASVLKDRLRQILIELAQAETLVTYKDLAERLGLVPPQTIHRVAGLLEKLMAEDAEAGRPLLASLCVGRLRHDLPAPGFFMTAEALGLFAGAPEGPLAQDFHVRELARVFDLYRQVRSG
ncbi:hypothetical protein [Mesorhizobium sp. M2C.T.Ca.TU.002.02.1.1]|uniref:hypothetical protein n=1 Tax=Mesorhizobium sp. M2C.T.Ca.TU.002.02.1.1 TaxID=2496788 RepID=UPI0019CF5B10|nr:hypothetical protein [Mesorhizobium sp. M2C.T.Ca.TU.002.02.1.1]